MCPHQETTFKISVISAYALTYTSKDNFISLFFGQGNILLFRSSVPSADRQPVSNCLRYLYTFVTFATIILFISVVGVRYEKV
jgi:hypothetical protein